MNLILTWKYTFFEESTPTTQAYPFSFDLNKYFSVFSDHEATSCVREGQSWTCTSVNNEHWKHLIEIANWIWQMTNMQRPRPTLTFIVVINTQHWSDVLKALAAVKATVDPNTKGLINYGLNLRPLWPSKQINSVPFLSDIKVTISKAVLGLML